MGKTTEQIKETLRQAYNFFNSKDFGKEGFCKTQKEYFDLEFTLGNISNSEYEDYIKQDFVENTLEQIFTNLGV